MLPNSVFKVNNVMGPFKYTGPQPKNVLASMEGKFFEFIIYVKDILDMQRKTKGQVPTYKNAVFPASMNIGQIALYKEIVSISRFEGLKFLKYSAIYNNQWKLVNEMKTPIANTGFTYLRMLIYVTPEIEFASSKLIHPIHGFVISYAEPILSCENMHPDSLLASLPYADETQFYEADMRWTTFSMTGEPLFVYNSNDFVDDDRLYGEWPYFKLRYQILYLETDKNRYEFIMEAIDSFSLYKLLNNTVPYREMAKTGRPVGPLGKIRVATGIEWKQIVWNEDSAVFNKLKISNIRGVFWMNKA